MSKIIELPMPKVKEIVKGIVGYFNTISQPGDRPAAYELASRVGLHGQTIYQYGMAKGKDGARTVPAERFKKMLIEREKMMALKAYDLSISQGQGVYTVYTEDEDIHGLYAGIPEARLFADLIGVDFIYDANGLAVFPKNLNHETMSRSRVRAAIKHAGLSLEEAGEIMGCCPLTVALFYQELAADRRTPSQAMIKAIEEAAYFWAAA